MKKLAGIIFLFSSFFFLAVPALADDESSIDAVVRTQEISITLSGNFPVDYGTLGYSQESVSLSGPFIINNTGTVTEDFDLHGENASNGNGSTWSLAEGLGYDVYAHNYKVYESGVNPDTIQYKYLHTSYDRAVSGIGSGNNINVLTKLKMPVNGSGTGTFNTKIWVRATASDSI